MITYWKNKSNPGMLNIVMENRRRIKMSSATKRIKAIKLPAISNIKREYF
jgi:hypothetical protein